MIEKDSVCVCVFFLKDVICWFKAKCVFVDLIYTTMADYERILKKWVNSFG